MSRASFNTLPLELKARIVEMASDQEDAWLERKGEPTAEELFGEGHINCLSSLALGNKELRALVAKHQFKVLSAKRASPPIFRFTIVPLYGHHIREVNFYNSASDEGSDNALSAMGQFPVLDTLGLQSGKALELFGSFQNPDQNDNTTTYRARMLALISPKIKTLVLHDFDPAEASAVVRRFPNLTALGFTALEEPPQEGDTLRLFSAIASARRLSSLAINVGDDFQSDWPPEAFVPLEREPPPLTSLQLLNFPLDQTRFKFIGLFSSTLEKLTLQVVESEQPEHSITPLRLPRLTHLSLSIEQPKFIQTIHLVASASTLSFFSVVHLDVGVDSTDPALLSFLDSQPTLRHVNVEWLQPSHPLPPRGPQFNPEKPSVLAAYTDLVHSRGLDPSVLDQPHLTPFHPDAKMWYTRKEQPFLTQSIRRTLEFGLVELDRMDAEGNVAKAIGWVPKLKALEAERLAWKD
ncbi:hypothetical protein RQP46_002507 [Phenoliferia psychrophenolica]